MNPLSREALEGRLALLVNAQFAELRGLTLPQDEQQDRQFHLRLAEADLREVDLLDCFERWASVDEYAACQTLLPALGLSARADAIRLERLLRMVQERPDSRANYISETLQVRFASEPSLPLDLAASFDSEVPIDDKACRVWATSFAMAHPVAAAQFVIDRLEPSAGDQTAASALVVAIPWRAVEVRDLLASHRQSLLTWLKGLLETNADDAWYCLVQLGQFDADADMLVADALKHGVSAAAFHVARSLFSIGGTTYGAGNAPLGGVLQRLVTLACADKSLCGNVDLALSSCLRKASQRPLAIDCLRRLGDGPNDVLERFNSVFYAVCSDATSFRDILTGWLLSPSASLTVISGMLNQVTIQRARAELDEQLLAQVSPEARTKVVRRLLGLLGDGSALCQFAANIARMVNLGDAGLQLANQMFNILKDEFPGATEEFLKPLADKARRRERGGPIFAGIYASVLQWRQHLEGLPLRPELRISDAGALALRSARMKQQAIIHRGAEEMSVFASTMTKIRVAQGHRFTSHMADGPMEISSMGHFSHSIELPSSELSDPMRGFIHRMKMLENSR
ncbi:MULTISPECIES: hypothetical protein [unclassified Roseateles]|uniref:hypothetical protein n=1 Tax=unclassified Roseateles TaxID=2626991 RepID=UPI000713293D|nr:MULTISPECIES: hypothetical protein [unclassified Roseateles]KQW51201.1 hypothetical protein ASC81_00665 [Pelomonas sp. Root405]KRA77433.1 hypothetical protein ASD88_00665 [Pelomonas sp. Root662]